ncbi:hypothetical protein ID866_9797 [Astraeus odoratus]|nr:hypothetical protein ID866_9797 [Astraeus odoratus]
MEDPHHSSSGTQSEFLEGVLEWGSVASSLPCLAAKWTAVLPVRKPNLTYT